MKYKRLTRKSDDGYELKRELIEANTFNEFLVNSVILAVDRLAELEDKIERGTMIELPCKVGDKIYWITSNNEIVCAIVEYIRITKYGIVYNVKEGDCEYSMFNVEFLTKAEVEAKLKENENETK